MATAQQLTALANELGLPQLAEGVDTLSEKIGELSHSRTRYPYELRDLARELVDATEAFCRGIDEFDRRRDAL